MDIVLSGSLLDIVFLHLGVFLLDLLSIDIRHHDNSAVLETEAVCTEVTQLVGVVALAGEILLGGEPYAIYFLDICEEDDGVGEGGGEPEHIGLRHYTVLSQGGHDSHCRQE